MSGVGIAFVVGLGLVALAVIGFLREPRRLRNAVLLIIGAAVAVLTGTVLLVRGDVLPAAGAAVLLIGFGAVVLGYPVLAIFLLANGITMLRREGRSLGNLLSLLLGVAMLAGPWAAGVIAGALERNDLGSVSGALSMWFFGVAVYASFCFTVFLVSSLSYRWFPARIQPGYVVVLGSGLLGGDRVPPLLAARLDRAAQAFHRYPGPPILIPSGGQGADEATSEAGAMAGYLAGQGVPAQHVLVEDRATTTEENLTFSRELMSSPECPTLVVTSSYHVFRAALLTRTLGMNAAVVGAPTAAYYVPSAFLREFVAVLQRNRALHAVLVGIFTLMVLLLFVVSFL